MLSARMQMAASGVSAGGGGTGPDDTTHYVEVTVASSQVASNLTDFPVYVDLSDLPAAFHSRVRSDGGDIRVTKPDGTTQLPREVVAIDTGASTGELHFKADSLSSSVDTVFRIYYGNASATEPAVTATYGRNAVWADYAAVYHGDDLVDATGNGNALTASGTAAAGDTGGKIGDAFSLPGSDNNYLQAASISGPTDSPVTVQAWFRPDTSTGNGQGIVSIQDLEAGANSTWLRLNWQDNAASDPLRAQAGDEVAGSTNTADTIAATASAWNFGVATADADGDAQVFLDGGNKASASAASVDIATLSHIIIGQWWTDASGAEYVQPFDGLIDEVRVRASVLADDWIAAEYTNQNTPGTFYSVGSEQSA